VGHWEEHEGKDVGIRIALEGEVLKSQGETNIRLRTGKKVIIIKIKFRESDSPEGRGRKGGHQRQKNNYNDGRRKEERKGGGSSRRGKTRRNETRLGGGQRNARDGRKCFLERDYRKGIIMPPGRHTGG